MDCIVIGAGVVGLAVARALSLSGREVLLLESSDRIGSGISSRNSEVIHGGIYYGSGSLKARLCVAGRDALYAECNERGVPHSRLGKLLVATDQTQLSKLSAIAEQARRNGVTDLRPLSSADVQALEPSVTCVAALLSPSTGIIDTHALMLAFQGDAEAKGMISVFNTPVQLGHMDEDGIVIQAGGKEPMWLRARTVVNSAGLDAPALAARMKGFPEALVPKDFLAKGSYFSLSGMSAPFSRLIYPMPDEAGLGVHVTLDLGGRARFGPDVEWVTSRNYQVEQDRASGFYAAIRRYWPGLPDDALAPDYAGIRPKIVGPGQSAADFVIQGPRIHGVPGLVNLFGIESPGITASIAIARTVLDELQIGTT